MSKLTLNIGEKKIKISKTLVKNQFKWLSTLFGIDTDFEEKNKLEYDILDYLPDSCGLEVVLILLNINEWVYDIVKYNNLIKTFEGRQAIQFLKNGPSELDNIKKWKCKICLKITNNTNSKTIKHDLRYFGTADCACVCVNCGMRWSSWFQPESNIPIYCKIINYDCQHEWEEI